jgi:hypothetical protein
MCAGIKNKIKWNKVNLSDDDDDAIGDLQQQGEKKTLNIFPFGFCYLIGTSGGE